MVQKTQPTGMRALVLVSAGQLISIVGTLMTSFALTFWAFEETGRATELALVGFFAPDHDAVSGSVPTETSEPKERPTKALTQAQ